MDNKNATLVLEEEPRRRWSIYIPEENDVLSLLTSNLRPSTSPPLTLSICQQVLVILLHCPVVYAELVLFYRVLLMDWINGNAI